LCSNELLRHGKVTWREKEVSSQPKEADASMEAKPAVFGPKPTVTGWHVGCETFFTTLFDKSPKRNDVRTEVESSSSTQ
jgi:hypothetical protein